ncbi:MAG: serine/threonine protein phosphatase [Bacteroidetes bacterium]|nr:serine/threonine protein phosphatase [Bacteroidota bacterium]MBS1541111.1 serine/threonine protein phosphatase [Bacteroidota bacterium]
MAQARTLAIGDIHGGFKALEQVLLRAQISDSDTLIFLGDYVDGWSDVYDLVEWLMTYQQLHKERCILLKGNHDDWCEKWLRTNVEDDYKRKHGAQSTYDSYAHVSSEVRSKHLNFFEKMKLYHIDNKNRLFVHAGFTSEYGPAKEYVPSYLFNDRTLWEMVISLGRTITKDSPYFPKRMKLFHEVFIGHTPVTDYGHTTPMNILNLWNLDTGAAFNGKLTVMDVDSKQYWQSDIVSGLYPNEAGRKRG